MLKYINQNLLEAKMDYHLEREKYERNLNASEVTKNYCNGYSKKNTRSSFEDLEIEMLILNLK